MSTRRTSGARCPFCGRRTRATWRLRPSCATPARRCQPPTRRVPAAAARTAPLPRVRARRARGGRAPRAASTRFFHQTPPDDRLIRPASQDGRASLHLAAYQGHLAVVQLLLSRGANVTATTAVRSARHSPAAPHPARPALQRPARARPRLSVASDRSPPWLRACSHPLFRPPPPAGGLDGAARGCRQGSHRGGEGAAAERRRPRRQGEGARRCCKSARAHLPASRPPSAHQHGRTALHAAAEKGHMEVAKLLVSAGADLKATDKARFASRARPPLRRSLTRPPSVVTRTTARRCTRRASAGACRLR